MNKEINVKIGILKKMASPQIVGCIFAALAITVIGVFFILRGTPVSDISFSKNTAEIIVGDTTELDYIVLPNNATNKTVSWKSSDTSVAEISDTGVVTAIREGNAVITISTTNGKIDECLITVKPTAFNYMKELANTGNGFTVGKYNLSSGRTVSIGFAYLKDDDSIYIIDDGGTYLASVIIPSSLSGEYSGTLERKYSSKTVNTFYSVDASTLTPNTNITSFYCDSNKSWDATDSDAVYTACVQAILSQVYQVILEPNGYTYADLGFNSYS